MKSLKRLFAIALVLALAFTLTIPALADGENGTTTDQGTIKVTVSNATGNHTFKAYQIFSGTLSADNTLTDVEWGSGIDSDETKTLYTELAKIKTNENDNGDSPFKDANTAAAVADVLTAYADNSYLVGEFQKAIEKVLTTTEANITSFTGGNTSGYSATVDEGYYLIVDEAKEGGTTATYASASMLQVIPGKTNTITAKQDNVPSVTKYAGDEGDDDNANYSVGDEIQYTITGTTKNYTANSTDTNYTYSYKIVDTMGAALDLIGTFSDANKTNVTDGVTVKLVSTDENGNETETDITSSFKTNDKPITYVENADGTHTLTLEAPDLSEVDGLTAQSKIVVTYKAKLNSNVTTGATADNTVVLTADEYKTTEDTDEVFPLTLKVTKTDGETGDGLEDAKFRLYRLTGDNNTKEYAEITQTGSIQSWTTTPTIAATVTSDKEGLITIVGLGDGTYYLEETQAPAGYNAIADTKIQINAVTEESATGKIALTKLTYFLNNGTETAVDPEYDADGKATTDTPNLDKGIVPITVENNQGAQLPSTGGIGTTIFYVLGGILVVGAAVLLITRKRMSAE